MRRSFLYGLLVQFLIVLISLMLHNVAIIKYGSFIILGLSIALGGPEGLTGRLGKVFAFMIPSIITIGLYAYFFGLGISLESLDLRNLFE